MRLSWNTIVLAEDVGGTGWHVLEEDALASTQEWGEREQGKGGWLAGSDIKANSRDGPGRFTGKRVSLVDLWSEFFGGGRTVLIVI